MSVEMIDRRPTIHINWTRYTRWCLSREYCPVCSKRTYFTAFFQDWYGWDSTCLRCGDRWMDGEMCGRPFMRGWRKQSIESAKREYRRLKAAGVAA